MASTRAGQFRRQLTGYEAFMPKPLPPDPPLRWDAGLLGLLSDATAAVGRLDGMAGTLPNPDLFVASYVRREAVLSSQIEGTQSSLDDVLAHEVEARVAAPPDDIAETVNYVRAMGLGLRLLDELPLSGRLIRRVHGELMEGVRGQERDPGEFRRTQNWIGAAGCTLESATFVPPAPEDLPGAIRDFEVYLNDSDDPPAGARSPGPRPVRDDTSVPRRQRPGWATPRHVVADATSGARPPAAVPEPLPEAEPERVLRPPRRHPHPGATGRAGSGSS